MASLRKTSGGWYSLRWTDNQKSPIQINESLKTTNKREALVIKARLETSYFNGEHDPWEKKWFEKSSKSNSDILIVALDCYLKSRIENKTWTDNTRITNKNRLRKYVKQLGNTRDCSSITGKEVFKLVNSQSIKESSMHSDLIKLRAFFNWMHQEKIIPVQLKIPHIRIQKKLPQFLTPEQIAEVCDYLVKKKKSYSKFQRTEKDNTLWHIDAIWLSARTGMRIEELMKLRIRDCASDQILVGGSYTTKSKKQRIVPLMEEAIQVVSKYTDPEFRAADPYLSRNDYLFGRKGTAPKVKLSRAFIKATWECLGIKRRFHDLRHSFAYWYLTAPSEKNTQFRLVALKEILGHESIETTMIYASISTNDLRL